MGVVAKLVTAAVSVAGAALLVTGIIEDLPNTVRIDDSGWANCAQIRTGDSLPAAALGCRDPDGTLVRFHLESCRDGHVLTFLPGDRMTIDGVVRRGGPYVQKRAREDCHPAP